MLKVVTIVGTRPEIIRLSRIIPALDLAFNHLLVHTGQNFDYELNEIFFKELKIRKPDFFFNGDNSSPGKLIGNTIICAEELLSKEKPDAVLILGDTNSSLAAVMAKRLKIPIYHMEAGNRSFDQNVPEEINRKIIDHISDFNLAYTEHARRNLLAEGFPARRIYLSGSPMGEVLTYFNNNIENSEILKTLSLTPKQYFLVSVHREENVDKPFNLSLIISILNSVSEYFRLPIIVSTHPRTKTRLEKTKHEISGDIQFLKPFGFFDYIKLQKEAKCTISDSGTISEEAAILGFPAVTLRKSMERPEALDAGSIIITGLDETTVLSAIQMAISIPFTGNIPIEYTIKNTSERVIKLILGTAKLSNSWNGIVKND